MFENLSLPHLLMVLAVAILVFGPKRIPEIAGSMGKGIREFKRHISDATAPETGTDSSTILPRPVINESGAEASTGMSRLNLENSKERGEPKRLVE
jgi:TatA/E family protein of Tat protein translocase